MPKVSVNIITHNRKELLKKAVLSVLNQTYSDFELIIVDDDSTDGTENEIINFSDKRIKYKKLEKQNSVSEVRNSALYASSGEYIALLDDDDAWIDKEKLAKQVEFLDNHSDYVLIGTGAIVIDGQGKEKYRFLNPQDDKKIKNNMLSRCLFINSSTMFRKEAVEKTEGYKNKTYIEDYNFWLDLGKYGKMANLPIFAIEYREHQNQQSKNKRKQILDNFKLIKEYKNYYPHYLKAKLRVGIKALIYGYLNMTWLYQVTASIKNIRNKK